MRSIVALVVVTVITANASHHGFYCDINQNTTFRELQLNEATCEVERKYSRWTQIQDFKLIRVKDTREFSAQRCLISGILLMSRCSTSFFETVVQVGSEIDSFSQDLGRVNCQLLHNERLLVLSGLDRYGAEPKHKEIHYRCVDKPVYQWEIKTQNINHI